MVFKFNWLPDLTQAGSSMDITIQVEYYFYSWHHYALYIIDNCLHYTTPFSYCRLIHFFKLFIFSEFISNISICYKFTIFILPFFLSPKCLTFVSIYYSKFTPYRFSQSKNNNYQYKTLQYCFGYQLAISCPV